MNKCKICRSSCNSELCGECGFIVESIVSGSKFRRDAFKRLMGRMP